MRQAIEEGFILDVLRNYTSYKVAYNLALKAQEADAAVISRPRVWYGVLLMVNLELAMITPPVGMNLFVIKGITDAPLWDVVRGAFPYVLLLILGLFLLLLFPSLATWLPYSAGYGG
jgi:TRAP-type mannitol/chloroaromatic compound transport system permease large subunit